jgi:hypothetical protein
MTGEPSWRRLVNLTVTIGECFRRRRRRKFVRPTRSGVPPRLARSSNALLGAGLLPPGELLVSDILISSRHRCHRFSFHQTHDRILRGRRGAT